MAVTARFYVESITRRAYNPEHAQITFKPAYNNGSGNEAWAEATPSGSMELYVNNPSAVEWFSEAMQEGRDLHITFEHVDRR